MYLYLFFQPVESWLTQLVKTAKKLGVGGSENYLPPLQTY